MQKFHFGDAVLHRGTFWIVSGVAAAAFEDVLYTITNEHGETAKVLGSSITLGVALGVGSARMWQYYGVSPSGRWVGTCVDVKVEL